MRKMFLGFGAAVALLCGGGPAAFAQEDIADKVISVPVPSAYRVDGLAAKPKVRNDPGVQGGKALRVAVTDLPSDAWKISLAVPINKPVKAGDKLVLAFWARLEQGQDGSKTGALDHVGIQVNSPPWTPIMVGTARLGPEWEMHSVEGVADKDYAAGGLGVSMHLGHLRQVIDFGPVFVLNMGQ